MRVGHTLPDGLADSRPHQGMHLKMVADADEWEPWNLDGGQVGLVLGMWLFHFFRIAGDKIRSQIALALPVLLSD